MVSLFRPWVIPNSELTNMIEPAIDKSKVQISEHLYRESTASDCENRSTHCSSSQSSTFDANISHSSSISHNPSEKISSSITSSALERSVAATTANVTSKHLKNSILNEVSMPATSSKSISTDSHRCSISRHANTFSRSNSSSSSRQSSPDMQVIVPEMPNISIRFVHDSPQSPRLLDDSPAQQMLNYSMSPYTASASWTEQQHGVVAAHPFLPIPGLPLDPYAIEKIRQDYARVIAEDFRAKNSLKRRKRPKSHRCKFAPCCSAFANVSQLKGHHRIHTGERPFKCEHESCGKTFTRNEELTRHKRIHTGVKPYGCEICGKNFGRRDHLKKHMKTHEERQHIMMMPFSPYYCSQYF